ncbi:MAG: hypothetical protein HY821_17745 [Acidobacteria bacterium]|nr:hypothetical protein [Acidobacteriota bacterium]
MNAMLAALLFTCLAMAQAPKPEARAWTILPLGDSMTECSRDYGCYRTELARMIAQAGYHAKFVGSRHNDWEPEAMRHDGYSGKTAEFLAGEMERIYTANPADVILLHSGHNHFIEEAPIPGIVEASERIIRIARQVNPRVIVLLAQVVEVGKLPKYAYIPDLNREIAKLAQRLDTRSQSVVLVNQAAGFDYRTDTVADLVHPNAQGARKIASRWFEALQPILSREPEAASGPAPRKTP